MRSAIRSASAASDESPASWASRAARWSTGPPSAPPTSSEPGIIFMVSRRREADAPLWVAPSAIPPPPDLSRDTKTSSRDGRVEKASASAMIRPAYMTPRRSNRLGPCRRSLARRCRAGARRLSARRPTSQRWRVAPSLGVRPREQARDGHEGSEGAGRPQHGVRRGWERRRETGREAAHGEAERYPQDAGAEPVADLAGDHGGAHGGPSKPPREVDGLEELDPFTERRRDIVADIGLGPQRAWQPPEWLDPGIDTHRLGISVLRLDDAETRRIPGPQVEDPERELRSPQA